MKSIGPAIGALLGGPPELIKLVPSMAKGVDV